MASLHNLLVLFLPHMHAYCTADAAGTGRWRCVTLREGPNAQVAFSSGFASPRVRASPAACTHLLRPQHSQRAEIVRLRGEGERRGDERDDAFR